MAHEIQKNDVLEVSVNGLPWRFSRRLLTKADIRQAADLVEKSCFCEWRITRDGVIIRNSRQNS